MKIVVDESAHAVTVKYEEEAQGRSRIILALEGIWDIRLTHQEARALGHALITDAARAQKELEG